MAACSLHALRCTSCGVFAYARAETRATRAAAQERRKITVKSQIPSLDLETGHLDSTCLCLKAWNGMKLLTS